MGWVEEGGDAATASDTSPGESSHEGRELGARGETGEGPGDESMATLGDSVQE